jgi:hypothetical protein
MIRIIMRILATLWWDIVGGALFAVVVVCLSEIGHAAEESSPLGGSGMTGGRGGYLGPHGAKPNDGAQPWAIDGREHVLMLGGAWGVPIKLICENAEDLVGNVNDEAMCIDRSNKAYAPAFQRLTHDGWVSCNPYDTSGYNSCSQH